MIRLERCTIEMPLRVEIVESLPVPLVADHVGLIAHQLLEAVEFRGLNGVRVAETNTKEIEQLVETRVLCGRHLAQSVTGTLGQFESSSSTISSSVKGGIRLVRTCALFGPRRSIAGRRRSL
jgi:hypothetical protein